MSGNLTDDTSSGDTSSAERAALIGRLAQTPQRIRAAVGGRSAEQLHAASSEDEWSTAEILAHVRAADDIQAHRVYVLLARDDPHMPAYDERRWSEVAAYARLEFAESLETFARRRAELVALLRRLAPEDWKRSGTHETRGMLALLDVVTGLVEHEEEHTTQIEALNRR